MASVKTKKILLAARSAVFKISAFWILVFAAYLALGRQFFPYVDRFKPELEVWLTSQLGTPVEIGSLSGLWDRFNPVLYISDVKIGDSLTISHLNLAPGFYESIARGGLSFIRFELIDFQADVRQTENGWQIGGLEQNNTDSAPVNIDDLLSLFRRQQEVQFINTKLSVVPLELQPFDVTLHLGQLQGHNDENELSAVASLVASGIEIPIELQVEVSQLDPASNRAFLKHGPINVAPWFVDIPLASSKAVLSGEYWVNFDDRNWLDVTARVGVPALVIDGRDSDIEISDLTVEAFVKNSQNNSQNNPQSNLQGQSLQAWFNVWGYKLNGRAFDSTQIKASYENDQLQAQWDSLPAAWVGQGLSLNDPNGFWSGISPDGSVNDGRATWSPSKVDSLALKASISDVSLSPYKFVPGVEGVSGTINIEGSHGRMAFNAEQAPVKLTELYDKPFQARVDKGILDWQTDADYGVFSQGAVDVVVLAEQDVPDDIPVAVYWATNSPTSQARQEGREGSVDVQVVADTVPFLWAQRFANTLLVASEVREFIDQRLLDGAFDDVELNFLSSLNAESGRFNQFFLNAGVTSGELRFLDDWPVVSEVEGELEITNSELTLNANSASHAGIKLSDSDLVLSFDDNQLTTRVKAATAMETALAFLKTGPLRPLYGDFIDLWYADGQADIILDLTVPLNDPNGFDVSVYADVVAENLVLGDIDLEFTDLQGRLIFDRDLGLYTQGVTAEHLGFEQSVVIDAQFSDSPMVDIEVTGQTQIGFWGRRYQDIFLSRQDAVIQHDTKINIQNNVTKVIVESNLVGWQIDLPEPYSKPSDQPVDLNLMVTRDVRNWLTVRSNIGEMVETYAEFDADFDLQRAALGVNQPLNVRSEPGIYVDVQASDVDAAAWLELVRGLQSDPQNALGDASVESFTDKISEINIKADNLDYLSRSWSANTTSILRSSEGWLVGFDSLEGRGEVFIPHDNAPIFADIEFVSLVSEDVDTPFNEQIDPLLNSSPNVVPNLTLQINKLIWNGRDLGNWRGEVEQDPSGLMVKNVVGNMAGATLAGELLWKKESEEHITAFKGNVNVGNIIEVLKTWEYAPVLTSTTGDVDVDVSWQGSPSFFDFKRLQGVIDLQLEKGAILDVEEYEGVKLIGLLNFTRVLQRIAFDFSDLLQQGITFDSIEGDLLFDRGFARVGERLEIDGSATTFRFSGDADLLSDELDIDMVLVVPLSSTFPLVALLAGVSPQAAAAIFVTERVFNNQLESLSSARMHIIGSFEEPQVLFYRAVDPNSETTQP